MAEINVERKPGGGMGWLWALLALIVLALLIWFLFFRRPAEEAAPEVVTPATSLVAPAAPVPGAA